jgi:hypothetical protein
MSGAVVGLAGAGAVYLAIRSGFRWAGRRCETALADAQLYSFTDDRLTVLLVKPGSHSLTRTEARDLVALQQAFDEARRDGRLHPGPAVSPPGAGPDWDLSAL